MTIEERKSIAVACHGEGYNCCQSVLCACCDLMGMHRKEAAALGYGFGGGMYFAGPCGALSGGLMAVGKSCLDGGEPMKMRPDAKALSLALEKQFSEAFGSLLCRDILAANGKRVCDDCISAAVENAADIIESYNKGDKEQ